MKISIDARGVNLYKGSGIGTYIENLLRELLNIDKKNTYSIFWAGENYNEFKKNNSKIIFTSKRHGGFYENYYYPSFIKNNNIDLHHVPQNGIGLNSLYTSPVVVTIHDLIPYIFATWKNEKLPPKLHFSSPRDSENDRKHSDFINAQDFVNFLENIKHFNTDIDIMLECKEKDLALFKLADDIKELKPEYTWIDQSTFIV